MTSILTSFSEIEQKKNILKSLRFRWNPQPKVWETTDYKAVESALQRLELPDVVVAESVKEALVRKDEKIQENLKQSMAVDSAIQVPAPNGMQYMPFQKAGIEFLQKHGNVLVADEMGLGKTIQVIGYLNLHPEMKHVLIIVPASLKLNWVREFKRWDVNNRDIGILNGDLHDVTITNYETFVASKNAETYFKRVSEVQWDVLVLDESHYIKSTHAKRTKVIIGENKKVGEDLEGKIVWGRQKGLIDFSKKVILLTGTPIMNRPYELFTQLRALNHPLGKSKNKFVNRYMDFNRYGVDPNSGKNLDELQRTLRTTCMIRREKKDVLLELPDKRRMLIEVPRNVLKGDLGTKEQQLLRYVRENWNLTGLKHSSGAAFEEISSVRHEIGVAKVPFAIGHLENLLEETDKIVVFAHHHDVLDAIYDHFKDVAVIATGQESQKERDEAVQKFQNNTDTKLFVASTLAMGVGITLTASSTVVFAEMEWRPGDMFQAEDRCHRIGQKDMVLAQYIVVQDSLEAYMVNTFIEKQQTIEQVMKSDQISNDLDIQELVNSFKEEEEEKMGAELGFSEEPKYIENKKAEPVLKALQIIASSDEDHATAENGMGFNKLDTSIGHSFAEKTHLTTKQYEIAKKILKKYHRQIPEELMEVIYK
jgi:SWI/SNF-related matrix-associated actin-dependent regulator 1 of chromatin subfamily A